MGRPAAATGSALDLVDIWGASPIDVLAGGGYEELSRLIAALESPTST
jgi:hypothetical protein